KAIRGTRRGGRRSCPAATGAVRLSWSPPAFHRLRESNLMTATAVRLLDNYVAGAWTPARAATGELDVTNPATGRALARVPLSGRDGLGAAGAAAAGAPPGGGGG